ncbi:MICAL 2 isoform X1 [Solea senegalensis]|uniref:MICAL 2 isoform X1 n=2 Tax=Solea senegalensis TaxID=28829 RepID=A0AAV6RMG3_SOLSE|nr:MICAL 2 isoform X1 [Solea senegalensis]
MIIRKESELVYIARTQELEQQQPGVEGELRRLLEKPDHLKSRDERRQETLLMQRLVEIVNGRNAIVEGLDEDRLREVEEDQQLNEMMKNLGVKKAKSKRKSSISKLFRRRSKRRVE